MTNDITTLFGKRLIYFDGGMGTLLQSMGLKGGERPERWNLVHPERIADVHARYLAAGCDVVTSNTFGATRAHLGEDAEACMRAGVRLARQAVRDAGRGFAAADMGSLGRLIYPCGDLPLEEAAEQFADAFFAGVDEGADLILIETMTDLAEVKAAVLGAREGMARAGRDVPLLVSLTFDERGRLLTGADIEGAAAMLHGLRVDAVGLNCGHEPKALMDNVRALLRACPLPVFVQPNASLPVVIDGKTTFPTTPEEFGRDMRPIALMGAWGLGGCCGTTPEHIRCLLRETADIAPVSREIPERCVVSGRGGALELGAYPVMIGERLNPTGKKRMKQALLENDMDYLMREALSQLDAGADVLDLNVGLPEIDESAMLVRAVEAVQSVCDAPLQLDTADPEALERALRVYIGKPLINSVCGKRAVMDAVFPLARKYGGALVALTLDENGIPPTVEGRLEIAQRIIREAEGYGIPRSELLFDALTMTVATDSQAALVTLETIRALKERFHVKTVLGVSNVSFGLPQRPLVTAAFIAMALHSGLDAAILNPGDLTVRSAFLSASALCAKDQNLERYLGAFGKEGLKLGVADIGAAGQGMTAVAQGGMAGQGAFTAQNSAAGQGGMADGQTGAANAQGGPAAHSPLFHAILRGLGGDASAAARTLLDGGLKPLDVIETGVMPALGEVGERYEKGTLFLPQLLASANAAQEAFEVIRGRMSREGGEAGEPFVLATVKGDVHDIGKNIVKVLLQNYGFSVIDLGRDVAPERVVEAARESGARMVGLSALMTTTVPAMAETVQRVHQELPDVKVIVGGAVLTQSYADQIHADFYAPDAMATVRIAQRLSGR